MTRDAVRRGVQERLDRLGVTSIDLLQFHWWSFEHPAWLDALHEMKAMQEEGLIRALGVTNFDAAHLSLALADGIPIDFPSGHDGESPLHYAAYYAHHGLVEFLVEQGADLKRLNNTGATPLRYALICGNDGVETAILLRRLGAKK